MSETALLTAVRNTLRTAMTLQDYQCDVELDEMVPAIRGDLYLVVMPGGISAGPVGFGDGMIIDELYSVDVSIIMRCTAVPRDRKREIFLANTGNLNARIRQVVAAIHGGTYAVMTAANTLITGSDKFSEPLRFVGIEGKPRPVPGEMFGASSETFAGLARRVSFGGARRIQHNSSLT